MSGTTYELHEYEDALNSLDPNVPHPEWVRIIFAAKDAELSDPFVVDWSSQAENFKNEKDVLAVLRSAKSGGGVGAGTLIHLAKQAGWKRPKETQQTATTTPAAKAVKPAATPRTGPSASAVWERCQEATAEHGYIKAKQGTPDGLRVLPASDTLTIAGQHMAGALVVPVRSFDGTLSTLQFIPPPGAEKKLNLPGSSVAGVFTVGVIEPGGVVYLCEGIGQAWACWKATGHAAVVCFGWGRVRGVAAEMRKQDSSARLVVVPDVGKEQEAEVIAREVGGSFVALPDGLEQNSDVNDYAQREGADALEDLLLKAVKVEAPAIELPFSVVFADELPDIFTPPDELVQGLLTACDGSVLYGDSNSGKTFFVIDLAAAVARGVPWMGRQTEPGLVIYLAAESPASVRSRLQAYQRHHGVKVPNFAIVQSPIDLFDGEADTDSVIQLVRQLEVQKGQKVRLIVGDTLARLSAGANENAGQDMGLVVRRFDRIRTECKAHFLLIHHSGKAAAAGARGWSGIRAAVDTEIEVSDSPAGRCAEITKQRDLSTKGDRIGFKLETVTLGETKWGTPATSCVVVPSEAPTKQVGKRISEVGGAVLEMLRTRGSGMKKGDVVKHFAERYDKSAVYRELKKLVDAKQVHECVGMVAFANGLDEVRIGAN